MIGGWRFSDMPRKPDPAGARARAEALFKPRQEQAAVSAATECKEGERAKSKRPSQLKTLGLPHGPPKHDC